MAAIILPQKNFEKQNMSNFILGIALITVFHINACTSAATLTKIASIDCNNGFVQLNVVPGVYSVPDVVSFNSRLYSFNSSYNNFGPTIRMKAGSNCTIRIKNDLATNSNVSNCSYHLNNFHCPGINTYFRGNHKLKHL